MLTPAMFLETPSSRTVTCRVQPPNSRRIWESSNEKRKFGSVPWSVAGGERMSGFWLARTGFFGPGLVPPLPGRVGCGIGGAVCACATVAAESAPPAAATASMSRREMEFEILLIFLSWSLSDWPPPRPSGAQPSIAYFRPLPASMS